jgi:membrane fusion protein
MDSQTGSESKLFRSEALEHYLREVDGKGVLQVSPPWTWMLLVGFGAMVVAAVVLSIVGRVEVNDRGKGILRPLAGVRVLLAPTGGVVAERKFNPGDFVPAGMPVIRLDSPQVQANRLEADRHLQLLSNEFTGVANQQDALYERQRTDLESRLQSATLDLESFVLSEQLQARKLKANQELAARGIVGRLELETAEESLEQARRQVRSGRQALQQVKQDLISLEAQRKNQLFTRKSEYETAKARVDAVGYAEHETSLSAPVAGYLDALTVRPGDLVQAGQPVAKVMPLDGPMSIVSFLSEKNRAYVHEGDEVKLELNQYPSAEYGVLTGKIRRVGKDLVSSSEWKEAMGEEGKPEEASFRVEIDVIPGVGGSALKDVQLRPGMLLNVRYTLRRQSLIAFAFSPIRRWLN